MSAPVGRETPMRSARTHARKIEALARRPTPPAGAATVEYAKCQSTTDWGTSYTILDFTGGAAHDSAVPTFNINANSNLEIFKQGMYRIDILFASMVNNASVTTKRLLEVKTVSGETPKGYSGNSWTTGHFAEMPTRIIDAQAGGIINVTNLPWPNYTDWMYFELDVFGAGTAGPSEIQVRAYKEEDGAGTSETQVVTHMFVVRIGDAWPDAEAGI